MPIDYKEYHPDWHNISKAVRAAAGNKCEECGVSNGAIILRTKNAWRYICATEYHWIKAKQNSGYTHAGAIKSLGFTKIILTVAHVDHDKTNNELSNLKAWCQRCHLHHDRLQHADNRKYGRNHKSSHQFKLSI